MPKWREQYAAAMAESSKEEDKEEEAKIDRVLEMWDKRVAWWGQEFKYPKNLKYKEKNGEGDAVEAGVELHDLAGEVADGVEVVALEEVENVPVASPVVLRGHYGSRSPGARGAAR